ncbi:MAG: (d)CMP kinase [Fibrobacterales bacterium]
MKLQTLVIAIDGPSGTGKSTTAKIVAESLGIVYLDTGAMYRAITFKSLHNSITPDQSEKLIELLNDTSIIFNEKNEIVIDGVVCETEIRSPEVAAKVSLYASKHEVRQVLTQKQREFSQGSGCILDGRDIGTVVFPNADLKFYLVADYRVRAERRQLELQQGGVEQSIEEVEKNLRERDEADSGREIAPLIKADDAIEINTTSLTIEQQAEQVCAAAHTYIQNL